MKAVATARVRAGAGMSVASRSLLYQLARPAILGHGGSWHPEEAIVNADEIVKARYEKAEIREHPPAAVVPADTPGDFVVFESDDPQALPIGFGTTAAGAWTDALTRRSKTICRLFTGALHQRINTMRGHNIPSKERGWVHTMQIFFSLEDTRDVFGRLDGSVPVRCRFSMGIPDEEAKLKLDDLAKKTRGTHFLAEHAKGLLEEYLLDFSFSEYTLDQLRQPATMPAGKKFRLLLVAESEMSPVKEKTYEDFTKLIEVNAPVRVMVHFAKTQTGKIGEIKKAFEDILAGHNGFARARTADWLFIGIPDYTKWVDRWNEPEKLPRTVFRLDSTSAAPRLVEEASWWSWDAPPAGT